MSLADRAKHAHREHEARKAQAHAERRKAESRRAKQHARRALAAVLEQDEDAVALAALTDDDHPGRQTDRPTYRGEAEGRAFIVRSMAEESDFAGLGGYRVFVVIGEDEQVVNTLAELGARLT